jgi:hypothetical protein
MRSSTALDVVFALICVVASHPTRLPRRRARRPTNVRQTNRPPRPAPRSPATSPAQHHPARWGRLEPRALQPGLLLHRERSMTEDEDRPDAMRRACRIQSPAQHPYDGAKAASTKLPCRRYSHAERRSTPMWGDRSPLCLAHGERSMTARPSAVAACLVADLRASAPRKRPPHPLQESLHCLGRDERAEPRRHSSHQTEHAADDSRLLELPHARQHPTGQTVPTVFLDRLRRKPPGSALGQGRVVGHDSDAGDRRVARLIEKRAESDPR